jgi:lipopolysaccharide transport system ATP-binding protein
MAVIRLEGIGKRYVIGHLGRLPGASLREAITESLHSAGRVLSRRAGVSGARLLREEFWALSGVSFRVEEGERVGIIGSNGAGKSTLLKILSRITRPTTGQARIRGRAASLLEVGTGFHQELTGRENIFLNGAILGMTRSEIRRKFDAIVDFSGVERFLDTPVKRYSSGMYVRLAFAVAAHLESEILLVDEVLAVGDAEFQKKCLGKMGEMGKEGRTVLFVSHNMNAIEQLCSRCLLLDRGRLVLDEGDIRKVIKEYLFGSGEGGSASNWVNPGEEYVNPWFTPRSVSITDALGAPLAMPVRNDAEMWVEIRGEVHRSDPALTLGYAVYTEEGILLYWSYHTDPPEPGWPRLSEGDWVLRGRIPARSLNEGAYRIELMGSLHYRQWLFEPGVKAPAVTLVVKGGLSDSPYWTARRPGLMAPVLEWAAHRGQGA